MDDMEMDIDGSSYYDLDHPNVQVLTSTPKQKVLASMQEQQVHEWVDRPNNQAFTSLPTQILPESLYHPSNHSFPSLNLPVNFNRPKTESLTSLMQKISAESLHHPSNQTFTSLPTHSLPAESLRHANNQTFTSLPTHDLPGGFNRPNNETFTSLPTQNLPGNLNRPNNETFTSFWQKRPETLHHPNNQTFTSLPTQNLPGSLNDPKYESWTSMWQKIPPESLPKNQNFTSIYTQNALQKPAAKRKLLPDSAPSGLMRLSGPSYPLEPRKYRGGWKKQMLLEQHKRTPFQIGPRPPVTSLGREEKNIRKLVIDRQNRTPLFGDQPYRAPATIAPVCATNAVARAEETETHEEPHEETQEPPRRIALGLVNIAYQFISRFLFYLIGADARVQTQMFAVETDSSGRKRRCVSEEELEVPVHHIPGHFPASPAPPPPPELPTPTRHRFSFPTRRLSSSKPPAKLSHTPIQRTPISKFSPIARVKALAKNPAFKLAVAPTLSPLPEASLEISSLSALHSPPKDTVAQKEQKKISALGPVTDKVATPKSKEQEPIGVKAQIPAKGGLHKREEQKSPDAAAHIASVPARKQEEQKLPGAAARIASIPAKNKEVQKLPVAAAHIASIPAKQQEEPQLVNLHPQITQKSESGARFFHNVGKYFTKTFSYDNWFPSTMGSQVSAEATKESDQQSHDTTAPPKPSRPVPRPGPRPRTVRDEPPQQKTSDHSLPTPPVSRPSSSDSVTRKVHRCLTGFDVGELFQLREQFEEFDIEYADPKLEARAWQYIDKEKKEQERFEIELAALRLREPQIIAEVRAEYAAQSKKAEVKAKEVARAKEKARLSTATPVEKKKDESIDALVTKARTVTLESPEQRYTRRQLQLKKQRAAEAEEAAKREAERIAEDARLRVQVEKEELEKAQRKEVEKAMSELASVSAAKKAEAKQEQDDGLITSLSEKWESSVDNVLNSGGDDRDTVAKSVAGFDLTRGTFGRILASGKSGSVNAWLNDDAVNGWFDAICKRKQEKEGWTKAKGSPPPFVCYNSAWWKTQTSGGIRGIAGWSRRKGIKGAKLLEAEKVFFPVNTGNHWTLLIVSPQDRSIEFLDSLGGTGKQEIKVIRSWLEMELGDKYKANEWAESRSRSQKQSNMSDCGVFACFNGLAAAKDIPYKAVRANKMEDARRMMAAVFMHGGFSDEFGL